MSLENYKQSNHQVYLDGRYFWKVLKNFETDEVHVDKYPLVIRISKNSVKAQAKDEYKSSSYSRKKPDYTLMRLVIEVEKGTKGTKKRRSMDYMGDELSARHSNLLILDHNEMVVTRFEPLEKFLGGKVEDDINSTIRDIFPKYELQIDDRHPQGSGYDNHFCNAYVLKYAYYFIKDMPLDFEGGEEDIHKFAHFVKAMYGHLTEEDGHPDIEFGLTKTETGVLGGAIIGGLVGGPVGLVAGGALGGLAGNASEKNERRNNRSRSNSRSRSDRNGNRSRRTNSKSGRRY